jgi:hypothetical protein
LRWDCSSGNKLFGEWTPFLANPLELEGVRSVGAVKTGVVLREITPVPEKHRQMAALRANVES